MTDDPRFTKEAGERLLAAAAEIRRLTAEHAASLREQGNDELARDLERTARDITAIAQEFSHSAKDENV